MNSFVNSSGTHARVTNSCTSPQSAQLPEHRVPAARGEPQQAHLGAPRADQGADGGGGRAHGEHPVAAQLQGGGQRLGQQPVVVDDHEPNAHGALQSRSAVSGAAPSSAMCAG